MTLGQKIKKNKKKGSLKDHLFNHKNKRRKLKKNKKAKLSRRANRKK